MVKTALIGHTGFVGTTLKKQFVFDDFYRSTNIEEIQNKTYDIIVCAGAPAKKWIANKDPVADLNQINKLINCLSGVTAKQFILISTVDVFKNPLNVNEDSPVDERDLHPYGLHRRLLEKFIAERFPKSLIVRLPGLVGPGLKKNVIYDFHNNNNLENVESRAIFQFYPMVNLWYDIQTCLNHNLSLIHLTSEPIEVKEVAQNAFGIDFVNEISENPMQYDFRSKFSKIFSDSSSFYQYSKKETLLAIRAFSQSEPKGGE